MAAAMLVAAFLVGGISTAEARLVSPPKGSHDLSAAGAGAGAEANPEVDAWHDAERRKLEADCDARLKALWAEKRRKLAVIVDQRTAEADATGRDVDAAKCQVEKELAELAKEKDEAECAKAKLPPKEAAVSAGQAEVQKWLDRIAELKRLIAEKQACVDALRQAEADLAAAKRKLAELKAILAAKMRQQAALEADQKKDEAEFREEQAQVNDAEDDIARAQARLDAAKAALEKALQDLREHDAAPAPKR